MDQAPAAVAILAGLSGLLVGLTKLVKYLLDFVQATQVRHEEFIREQNQEWQTFIGNHMSTNTKALKDVAKKLEQLSKVNETA